MTDLMHVVKVADTRPHRRLIYNHFVTKKNLPLVGSQESLDIIYLDKNPFWALTLRLQKGFLQYVPWFRVVNNTVKH